MMSIAAAVRSPLCPAPVSRNMLKAPGSCFNYCNGASYHGYPQQLSAPNSFAYGTHTGYGNYQQPWKQLPPTPELPIGASWQHPPPPVQRQPTPRK